MPCESNFQASIEVKTPENTSRYTLRKEVPSGQRQDDLAVVRSGKLVLDVGEPSQKTPDPHHKGSLVDLHRAAYGGSIECVKYLLPCFEDKDKKFPVDENGWTCLHHAVAGGSDLVVKYLMNNGGFDLDQRTGDGLTPLMLAAQFGSLSVAKLLVETYKCDVNEESTKMSSTPMMFAAQYGHRPIVELLVNHGADVFQKAHGSLVALHHAAYGGSLECVKYLMPLFGDRKFEADENGLTCLHWAVLGGNLTVVRYLVGQWGFDLRLRTAGRLDCFLLACEEGHREIVRELLKRDEVDRNAVDEDGHGALHLAKKGGHTELVQMLVQEFGFPPDTSDNVSSLQAEGGSDPSEREGTSNLLTDEAALKRLCWIPFDIKTVSIEAKGGILCLEPMSDNLQEMKEHTIFMEVPPDAVSTATNVKMRYAIIPSGLFTLPEGYQFGSPVVYIYYDSRRVTKPLVIHLPHWYGGEDHARDGLSFAVTPHSLKGRSVYHFELLAGGKFPDTSRYGVIEIRGHCSLFTTAFKNGATVTCQAFSLVKEIEGETECKVECNIAVTKAAYCWRRILLENRSGWEISEPNPFQFKSDRITATLKEKSHAHGDWKTYFTGASELLSSHVRYDVFGIDSEQELEDAVKDYAYPPAIKYIVKYRKELRRTGRSTEVILHISGMDQEMDFPCTAYERIQGEPSLRKRSPEGALQHLPPNKTVVRWDLTGSEGSVEAVGVSSSAPVVSRGAVAAERSPPICEAGQPLAKRVLMECQTHFLEVVAVKDIYRELCQKHVIHQTVADKITHSHSVEEARGHLFDHMRDYGTLATLKVFCDVISSDKYNGFRAMQDFGAELRRRLVQEGEPSLTQHQPPAKTVVRCDLTGSERSVEAVGVSSSAPVVSRGAVAAERSPPICEGEHSQRKRSPEGAQQDQPPAKTVVRCNLTESEGSVEVVDVSGSAPAVSRGADAAESGPPICEATPPTQPEGAAQTETNPAAATPPAHLEGPAQTETNPAAGSSTVFAVITANSTEENAVRHFLQLGGTRGEVWEGAHECIWKNDPYLKSNGITVTYTAVNKDYGYEFFTLTREGSSEKVVGVHTKCLQQAAHTDGGAQDTATTLLHHAKEWPLKVLFSVGCCSYADDSKSKENLMGCVLLTDQINASFHRGKMAEGTIQHHPEGYRADRKWISALQDHRITKPARQSGTDAQSLVKFKDIPVKEVPRIESVPMVVKSDEDAQVLRGVSYRSGIEMEAVGFIKALNSYERQGNQNIPKFASVKCVSDSGSGKHRKAETTFFGEKTAALPDDERQLVATLHSIALVIRGVVERYLV